jgi:hypothetical protein
MIYYKNKMSSADFQKVLVRDERLNCKDSIKYAVNRSGQNITIAEFNAISATNSSHTYNIQVPSETTIIDRRVIWESTCVFKVSITPAAQAGVPNGTPATSLGYSSALGAFPLHGACLTQQFTINNNSVSVNMSDVLPAILRFHDKRELNRYNGMTPALYDTYGKYADGLGASNNILGNYGDMSLDNDLYPRGSFSEVQVSGNNTWGAAATAVPTIANPNPVLIEYYVRFTSREPLLASPFMWAKSSYSGQGFYGIQNLNVVMNLATDNVSRLWRSGAAWDNVVLSAGQVPQTTYSVVEYTNSKLIFNFLTPKPSDMLSARNVVPYWEMPRYLSTATSTIGYATREANTKLAPATATIPSTTIQLNQIPDKLLIFVRKAKNSQLVSDGDFALAISRISINFNNQSGILASSTRDQLYRFSVEAGSNQSFHEFRGKAQLANNTTGFGKEVATSGSYLMLDMGRHIQITEDYYASGSLGNFNLQFSIDVENYIEAPTASGGAVATTMPIELVLITLNSGLFVCEKGQSATYTGILTKDDVLSAAQQTPHSTGDVERMVGGGLLDKLGSFASAVAPHALPMVKNLLSGSDNKFAKLGAAGLGALGYGATGGRRKAMEDRLM